MHMQCTCNDKKDLLAFFVCKISCLQTFRFLIFHLEFGRFSPEQFESIHSGQFVMALHQFKQNSIFSVNTLVGLNPSLSLNVCPF